MSKTTFTVFAEADLSNVAFTVADGLPRAESSALITSSARANFVWSNQSPTESLTPLSLSALRISGSVIVLIPLYSIRRTTGLSLTIDTTIFASGW